MRNEGVLVIGSQPDGHNDGYESILRFYEREGARGVQLMVEEIQAFEEDGLGWVADRVVVRLLGDL